MSTHLNNRKFRKARGMRFLHGRLILGAFSMTAPSPWPGASIAPGTLAVNPGFNFAFKLPIAAQSETFVPIIRWNNGSTYYRYKLWSTGDEIAPFPPYRGEKVPTAQNPTLEIWTVQGENPLMSASWYLDISPLELPDAISDLTATTYTPS